ncbi:DUF881 domain-containing protein [Alteribacillus bidgolensis]|uniref:DUF881 domain-containing protein n=1 Tax=Alteribacillus bidgolensis TaxID=930129 RepID=UPI000B863863|nr:DUF881 domain-containing protein [Alteribacillus bidgolensis]
MLKKSEVRMLTILFMVLGFLLTLSYQTAAEKNNIVEEGQALWEEDRLRNSVLEEQEQNKELEEEWRTLQGEVREIEEEIAGEEVSSFNLVEDLERLRMLTGEVPVKGPGIEVTLNDHTYVPDGSNPNDYIVHERHIQEVVDELVLADAEAISINGFRITRNSYIQCIGPVIKVDSSTSAAPFVIQAVGDPEQLEAALELSGGVKDKLVNENVEVRTQKQNQVMMEAVVGESE